MSYYEDLKKVPVLQPGPPPTQEEELRRRMEEEAAWKEREIYRRMEYESVRFFASKAMEHIKTRCHVNQSFGKRRLFGFFSFYDDTWDPDGYSVLYPHRVEFHEWKDGVRSQEREITTTAPTDHSFRLLYNSWEECQAIMRTLARLMAEEGFPDGCLSTYTRPMRYRERQIVNSFWSGKKEIFIDHDYEVYEVEVDIRW